MDCPGGGILLFRGESDRGSVTRREMGSRGIARKKNNNKRRR